MKEDDKFTSDNNTLFSAADINEDGHFNSPNYLNIAHNLSDERKRTSDILLTDCHENSINNGKSFTNILFSDLQLSLPVLQGLNDAGFVRPSPVQIKAIPLGRLGMDLIVQAKSGTGKTVVFAVVILEAIDTKRSAVQALILSPTREIAFQSQTVVQRLGMHIPDLKCHLFVGGLPLADDLRRLNECHIAVGTPGRVRYLLEEGYLCTEHIRQFVLDEADLLLAGGSEANLTGGSANNAFPADINFIWWNLPQSKQVLALSATYTTYLINEHLPRYMNDPALIRLAVDDPALLGVRQFFHFVQPTVRSPASVFAAKIQFLCKILNEVEFQQCLIFSNFHSSAQDLCDALHSRGWPVTYISSSLEQEERFKAFNKLRTFQCRVLISTDLTSRGIDAENVNLVISLEVPWEHETYVHRVGRAGRFGSYGASIIIVSDVGDECKLLRQLEAKCPQKIRQLPLPIPSNLATPECSIELENLVTVVNCLNEIQPQTITKGRINPTTNDNKSSSIKNESQKSVRLKGNIKIKVNKAETDSFASPHQHGTKESANMSAKDSFDDWNSVNEISLSKQLCDYLNLTTDCESHLLSMENKNSSAQSKISLSKEFLDFEKFENSLLNCVDDYLTNKTHFLKTDHNHNKRTKNMIKNTKNEVENLKFNMGIKETKSVTERPYQDQNENRPESNNQQLNDSTSFGEWTSRQISAWYEYHNLINYAHEYYAQWLSAYNEYCHAVENLNNLRNLSSSKK